jgi:hypothetical protein
MFRNSNIRFHGTNFSHLLNLVPASCLIFKIGPHVYKYIQQGVNAWIGYELEEDNYVQV